MLKSTRERPGWLLPYLMALDAMFFRRWIYWHDAIVRDRIPEEPIPYIKFDDVHAYPEKQVQNNVNTCLQFAQQRLSSPLEAFIDWLLWGFKGGKDRCFPSITEEIDDHWYRTFNLGLFYVEPADHFSELAAQQRVGQGSGFFATPMSIVNLMVDSTMRPDCKAKSVLDPCCGTGSMLLAASNYSLNLYASDIQPLLCKMALCNAYIYVPWLAFRPKHLTLFDKASSKHWPVREGLNRPVCQACGNQREFQCDVEVDVALEMRNDGLAEISMPEISPDKDIEYNCVHCTKKEE
jgi:hypothetical protein